MKAGKSPYEIRSDLLKLAYDIVKGRKEAECASTPMLVTTAPTTAEIIDEATKLNTFVSQT